MPPVRRSRGPHHRIVDLFAGPGGLDVGATWLGVPVTGVELDDDACSTREAAKLETVRGDVRDFGPTEFPESTILTGGPPCQTFTVAGSGTGRRALEKVIGSIADMVDHPDADPVRGWSSDERTELILEPLRWALLALRTGNPFEAIVLEQVPAVLQVWQAFATVLEKHGYRCAVGILRSEEFGVPQTRRRAILIARLGGAAVSLPTPTHDTFRKGTARQQSIGRKPWVSMGEALQLDTSFTVVSNYGSGGDPRNRGRRTSDEPAATVTGKIMRNRLHLPDGHWSRFTHHEAGALQTFPYDFPWSGSDIGQQIGNAIPPRLAVHILAHALRMKVDDGELDRVVKASWVDSSHDPISTDPQPLRDAAVNGDELAS